MKLTKFFRKANYQCVFADNEYSLMYVLKTLLPTTYVDNEGVTHNISIIDNNNWQKLETQYFFNYSPNKETSVLLDNIYDGDTFATDEGYKTEVARLANVIAALYSDNWARLRYALDLKYNPIENYNGTETNGVSDDYRVTANFGAVTTNDVSGATVTAATVNTTIGNNVYGFNSSTAVPASQGLYSTSHDAPDTSSSTNTHTEQARSDYSTQTGETIMNKHGNLGITTTQKMLNEEKEFRANFNYYKLIFDNIDDILTCKTYAMEDEE